MKFRQRFPTLETWPSGDTLEYDDDDDDGYATVSERVTRTESAEFSIVRMKVSSLE